MLKKTLGDAYTGGKQIPGETDLILSQRLKALSKKGLSQDLVLLVTELIKETFQRRPHGTRQGWHTTLWIILKATLLIPEMTGRGMSESTRRCLASKMYTNPQSKCHRSCPRSPSAGFSVWCRVKVLFAVFIHTGSSTVAAPGCWGHGFGALRERTSPGEEARSLEPRDLGCTRCFCHGRAL